MAKPILIVGFSTALTKDAMDNVRGVFDKHRELKKEYHVLVFDRMKKDEFHVLNGEHEDIKSVEDFIQELRDND